MVLNHFNDAKLKQQFMSRLMYFKIDILTQSSDCALNIYLLYEFVIYLLLYCRRTISMRM